MGRKFKKSKYAKRDEEHLKSLRSLTKKASDYKPKELDITKAKPLTSNDLPDRPKAPGRPEPYLPGNALKAKDVSNPSGRSGTIKEYKAQTRSASSLRNAYKYAPTKGAGNLAKFKRKIKGK